MESNARLKQDSESRNGRGSERNNQHFFCFESLQISDRLSEHRTVLLHFSLELPSCLDTIYETERYTPTLVAPPHTHTSGRHQSPALCPCRWPYPCGPGHPPPCFSLSHYTQTPQNPAQTSLFHKQTNIPLIPTHASVALCLCSCPWLWRARTPHNNPPPLLSVTHTHAHSLSLSLSYTHTHTVSAPPSNTDLIASLCPCSFPWLFAPRRPRVGLGPAPS